MPARRTNPLHRGAGCSRRTAQGRCEAVKQPPFRDIFGVVRSRRTAARVPDTGSDLGTVRQVTQVPGHPDPSADRRGGVVHTPVGKRPGVTTLAAALTTAAITGTLAWRENAKVEEASPGTPWAGDVEDHYERATSFRRISYISAAVGVVGLATGGGLVIYTRSRGSARTPVERAALVPTVHGGNSAGISVVGRF